MEPKVNYARVGLFVLLLGGALLALLLWLGKSEYGRRYDRYYVYVRESVTGLNRDAPVKYRGVSVGYVSEIVLNPENPQTVRLKLDILHGTPIKEDTVAVLEFQGLTGLALVNLNNGSPESPTLTPRAEEPYPVIQNAPSLYSRLDRALSQLLADPSLPQLITHLNDLTMNANRLVDPENRAALKEAIAEMTKAARTLDRTAGEVNKQLPFFLADIGAEIGESGRAFQEMLRSASETSATVKRLLDQNRAGVEQFTGETLPEAGTLVAELRQLTVTLKRLASELEREPNTLIFGKPPLPRGPGE